MPEIIMDKVCSIKRQDYNWMLFYGWVCKLMCAYCIKTYYETVKNGTFIKHDLIYNGFSFFLVGWYRYMWITFPIKERKFSVRKLKNKWTDLLSRILSYWINESFLEFNIKFLYYNVQKWYAYPKQIWPGYETLYAYIVLKII